jgi:alkylation response protein AidB-like acyl-CoA dehydrogenase
MDWLNAFSEATLLNMKNSSTSPFHVNESIREFEQSARDTLANLSPLGRLRRLRHKLPRFEATVWTELAKAGWTSILVAEDLGGLGLDLQHACAIAKEVGQNPIPEPYFAAVQCVAVLNALPQGELRDQLLMAIASGDLIVGLGWQERSGQIEPEEALTTVSIRTSNGYELTGQKRWVTPGTGANGWLISALEAGDVGLWWVPAETPGIAVTEVERIDGSSCATLTLNNIEIPKTHRLGFEDNALDALGQGTDAARLAQSAELLGIATRVFDMTLDYMKTRVQFDKPIGANQALQHKMVDAYIQLELATACLSEALTSTSSPEQLRTSSSRAKARCAEVALSLTRLGIQMHGAIGFTDEYDLGLYFKRALQLSSSLGSIDKMRLRYHEECTDRHTRPKTVLDKSSLISGETKDWSLLSEAEFRALIRNFLKKYYPERLRNPSHRLHLNECKDWYLTLSEHGWIAPSWPKSYGGMGLPSDKLLAFIEEMEDYGVCRLPDQGIINLGPVLIQFGSEKQKAHYLPKILSGEHIWCQGYSEPNAGSDLASLRTEAVANGNDFMVNGQKIWTTLAQDATHMFALVRTDRNAKKQNGISFLLIDLSSPGITIRPIKNIAAEEEFCEVFFDNVRVPQENIVGELNAGWTIAKTLLGFERLFVGSPKTPQYALHLLEKVAYSRGLFENERFKALYAKLELDVTDLKTLYGTFAEIVKKGESLPISVSILKIFASETYTAITRCMFEECEEDGGQLGDIAFNDGKVNVTSPMFNAIITTIYAGSNEIQRNILAKSVLNLPIQ